MTVCPALFPPWLRTTISASAVSTSMILPLPSSPHCAPIKMVLAMETINCPDASGSDTFGTTQNDRMRRYACKEFRRALLVLAHDPDPAHDPGQPAAHSKDQEQAQEYKKKHCQPFKRSP